MAGKSFELGMFEGAGASAIKRGRLAGGRFLVGGGRRRRPSVMGRGQPHGLWAFHPRPIRRPINRIIISARINGDELIDL